MRKTLTVAAKLTAFLTLFSLIGCGGPRMSIHAAIEMLELLGKSRINPAKDESKSKIEILGKPCILSQPKESIASEISKNELKIEGENCPLEYTVIVDTNLARTITETHFFAKTEEIKKQSEIEALHLIVETIPVRAQNLSQIKFNLSALSTERGQIDLTLGGDLHEPDMHNGTGEISGQLTFNKKIAEIKHVVTLIRGQEQDEVYINGEKLNPDERNRVLPAVMH